MKKTAIVLVALAAVIVVGAIAFSGCIEKKSQTLTVGTEAAYPPLEYIENGTFVGFDVDLMREIGKRLGLTVEFVNTPFDKLIPGLEENKFDCAISAITITGEWQKNVSFSDSYFNAGQTILVRENYDEIADLNDLKGKAVGVQIATTGEAYTSRLAYQFGMNTTFEDIKSGNTTNIKVIRRYVSAPDAIPALKKGDVDAVICDNTFTEWVVNKQPGEFKIVGGLLTEEKYGIAVNKEEKELLTSINKALKEIEGDGTREEIYEKWFRG